MQQLTCSFNKYIEIDEISDQEVEQLLNSLHLFVRFVLSQS